jgi:tetratricopeptide (TPR) repeat protein
MRFSPLAVVAALLLTLGSPSSSPELPEALQPSFEEGVQALRAGKLDAAEAAFKRVLDQGGRVAYVHNNLGLVYQERGQHNPAVAQFREAIRLDAAYGAPRLALGSSLLALDQVAEATRELEQAAKVLPREPLARLQLARAYERASKWTSAVEQYRILKDLAPQEPEYAYLLGRAYLRLSEWSVRHLQDIDPGSARLEQALGHNYRVQGRTDQALRAFERAAAADPTLPEIHLSLAQIHMELKNWEDARKEIERELAIVPESAGARALLERLQAEEAKAP